jgi:hypothetical protein
LTVKLKAHLVVILLGLAVLGCDFFDYSPLQILSYSPDNPRVLPSGISSFSFTFSEPVQRAQGEKYFSLRGRTGEVNGFFRWPSDSQMVFVPLEPLSDNDSYSLRIESALEDLEGDNLEKEFFFQFGQITDLTPPNAVTFNYDDPSPIPDELRPDLVFTFEEEVTFSSFLDAFSISPSPLKTFTSPDNRVFTVSFLEDLDPQTSYQLRISQGITDLFGNSSSIDHEWRFEVGSDENPPSIVSVTEASGSAIVLEAYDENDTDIERTGGLPTEAVLSITFDGPMDQETVESAIDLSPSRSYSLDWSPDSQTLNLSFDEGLIFEEEYYLRLSPTAKDQWGNALEDVLYIFSADSPNSQPPLLQSISFGPVGSVLLLSNDTIVVADTEYTESESTVNAELHLHFDLAPGASLEAFNAMDNILVEYTPQGSASPPPPHSMKVSTLRIDGGDPGTIILGIIAQDDDDFLGTLSLQIFEGLADDVGRGVQTAISRTLFVRSGL